MRAVDLRDYQDDTIQACREKVKRGQRKIVLVGPTGSGKTEMAIAILQAAIKRGKRVAFLVERNALLTQSACLLYTSPSPRDS